MQRKEFFKKLSELYPKVPSQEAQEEYNRKLSDWKVSAKQLEAIFQKITENCEYFPTIAVFAQTAQECGVRTLQRRPDVPMLAFTLKSIRWFMRCLDPAHPPVMPEGSRDSHLFIPEELKVDDSSYDLSVPVARECFRRGFVEVGGNLDKLSQYWNAVASKPEQPRKPMRYDDKDAA